MWTLTSDPVDAATAYVWIWLPGASEPIPAGRLDRVGVSLIFRYGNATGPTPTQSRSTSRSFPCEVVNWFPRAMLSMAASPMPDPIPGVSEDPQRARTEEPGNQVPRSSDRFPRVRLGPDRCAGLPTCVRATTPPKCAERVPGGSIQRGATHRRRGPTAAGPVRSAVARNLDRRGEAQGGHRGRRSSADREVQLVDRSVSGGPARVRRHETGRPFGTGRRTCGDDRGA